MPQSVLEIAKELTLTFVKAGGLSSEDMHNTLQKTYATLLTLKAQEETGTTLPVPVPETPPARVDWRKSITKRAISCLECGQTFKQLSARHLRMHGLNARSYRAKYGIPRTASLTAREITVRRREIVRETRPWEKAPTYRRAQERDGHAPSEPEAETPREATEEPVAAAPTHRSESARPPRRKPHGRRAEKDRAVLRVALPISSKYLGRAQK